MNKKRVILGCCTLAIVCGALFYKPVKEKIVAIQHPSIPLEASSIDTDTTGDMSPQKTTLEKGAPLVVPLPSHEHVEQLASEMKYDEALIEINRLLDSAPQTSDTETLLSLKGKILEAQGNLQGAQEVFLQILEKKPENCEALVHVGYAAMLSQDIKKAMLYTNRALNVQPDHSEGLFLKAQLFMTLNDVQGALTYLDNALMYDPDNTDFHLFKYKMFEGMKQVDASLSVLRDVIRIDPLNKDAHLLLIGTLQQNSRFEEAQKAIDGLRTIYPQEVTYKVMAALNLETLGKLEASEDIYRKAITKNPENAEIHMHLGKFFLRAMQYRKAVSIFDIAVAKTNQIDLKSNIYGDISFAEFKAGKLTRARDAMEKALQLDAQQPHALLSKAKFMMQNGEFAQAKNILMTLLQENEWPDVYYNLAVARENLGESVKSIDELVEKTLALSPGDPEFLMFSAERDLRANNKESSKEKLKKIMSMTGRDKHQYAHLIYRSGILMGDLAVVDGDLETALGVYEQMQNFGAQDPTLYEKLCSAYIQTNNTDKAKIAIARLEEMSPDYEGLQDLKAEVAGMEVKEKG